MLLGHTHVDRVDVPTVTLQFFDNGGEEAFVGGGIGRSVFCRCVIEICHVGVVSAFGAVVVREILDEFAELALILDIHGFDGVH